MDILKNNFDLSFFYRKKTFSAETVKDSKLNRVLGLFDLTALGPLKMISFHSSIYCFKILLF